MAILDFSVSGWHGFGSVTQVCFGISVSNFMCMSIVAVGRSLTIVSYVAFKIAALWFWTMFNCNPPIAHCHPLLWGGGILVDHWSTISSYIRTHEIQNFDVWLYNLEQVLYRFEYVWCFKITHIRCLYSDVVWQTTLSKDFYLEKLKIIISHPYFNAGSVDPPLKLHL